MWAEKLYDTSFEGLQPYGFVYLRETDFKEKPWYPSGATNRSHCTRDKSTKVSGEVSMKIDVPAGPPATVGISQDGLAVSDLDPCNLSCWLRQQNLSGPITVKIHRAGQVLASCEFKPTGQWEKFKANLDFKAAATDATITISFRGPGTRGWTASRSCQRAAMSGWRADVVEAVAKPIRASSASAATPWTFPVTAVSSGATPSATPTAANLSPPGADCRRAGRAWKR